MKTPSQPPAYVSRDNVNFYHHIGKPYPTESVCASKSRVLMDLFGCEKSYVVLKSLSSSTAANIESVDATLYRKDSVLALRLRFIDENGASTFSLLPISATNDATISPRFPALDSNMQIEVHFIDHFDNNRLTRVLRLSVLNEQMTKTLVSEYQAQQRAEIDKDTVMVDMKTLLSTPYKHLPKYEIANSQVQILKSKPVDDEQQFMPHTKPVMAVA
ncbi:MULTISPECIES: hypothetical protein [Vibrio]|uniref:hypothetical protein n=1 Tax=Vibrio TaxID=662 RepID=UPI002075E769|nr:MULTISPECIES: hypothetical protein [Vibrio]USD35522.1 hypothetical protein J8Z27_23160 [Vibrio sp. SCSIO 43186]USD72646.1 hypothetical protein J4N41_23165 [Vibrio sp. SCSIO 43139]USD98857.1 hypothetical protein CTT30_22505 [Vibrio coralliilyticus]